MRFEPVKKEENILNIPNINQKIYRIFSYQRFSELMINKKLTLINPSKWDDPFDNFFLKTKVNCGGNEIAHLKSLADSWYGQCWTTNKDTDAMWRIYSHNKDGIRVSTTVEKLFSSIFDDTNKWAALTYFISKVKYKKKEEIIEFLNKTSFREISSNQNYGFANLLSIKRNEFSHESEVRLLVNDVDGNIGKDGCYELNFDPNTVFDDICVDPRLTPEKFKLMKIHLNCLDVDIPIIQSQLYQLDLPMIKLE